jgi:hypothetical protein
LSALFLALVILAGLLGAIDVVRSRGQALTSWGVVALAVALLLRIVA